MGSLNHSCNRERVGSARPSTAGVGRRASHGSAIRFGKEDARRYAHAMRSRSLGQNFLRNRRTARRLVHLAGGADDGLCVDLGAGNGSVTAAAASLGRRVLAIEVDERLVRELENRFGTDERVSILSADIVSAPIPNEPFVVAANPPFNLSTKIVRRWMLASTFKSGALIVETAFARRISGAYGATKLSLTLLPFLDMTIPYEVRSAEFAPSPNVSTSILQLATLDHPAVDSDQSGDYTQFVNYIFERGSRTLGEALAPIRTVKLSPHYVSRELRSIDMTEAVGIFESEILGNQPAIDKIRNFNDQLPRARRPGLATGNSV